MAMLRSSASIAGAVTCGMTSALISTHHAIIPGRYLNLIAQRPMRYRLLVLLTLLLCFVIPVTAQEPADLNTLRIALWPEFDDPRLLVIIDGQMNQAGQTVRIPLPAQAEVNAVATMGDDGDFLNAEWETASGSDGTSIISFKPAQPNFRVEYYMPLATNGGQRIGNFSVPAGYFTAADTVIEALLPPSATG